MTTKQQITELLDLILSADADAQKLRSRVEEVRKLRREFLEEHYAGQPTLLGLHNTISTAMHKVDHLESRKLVIALMADILSFMVPPLAMEAGETEPEFCESECARGVEEFVTLFVEQCTALGFIK